MTRTEDRLTEYLNAVADSVRAHSIRALAPSAPPESERTRGALRLAAGQRRWRGWAVPLAAAATVVAVAVSSAVLAGQHGGHRAAPAAAGATAPGLRYYMEAEGATLTAVVRSVATGAVVDRVPAPGGMEAEAMAAAPDDRTFYIAYGPEGVSDHGSKYMLYSVSVVGSGKVTAPMPVKGGVVTYANVAEEPPALAVSPDGGRLAMTLSTYIPSAGSSPQQVANEILVINLHTGARQTWQRGLNRAGYTVTVPSVAWAGGGRSLDFLATWCVQGRPYGPACYHYINAQQHPSSQVRSLPLNSVGGSLDNSTALLDTPYPMAAMSAAPAGGFYVLILSGWKPGTSLPVSLGVEQFTANGTFKRVVYNNAYLPDFINSSSLTADPSGQHLLLGLGLDHCAGNECGQATSTLGWLAGGTKIVRATFHPLTSYGNTLALAAW